MAWYASSSALSFEYYSDSLFFGVVGTVGELVAVRVAGTFGAFVVFAGRVGEVVTGAFDVVGLDSAVVIGEAVVV